MAKLSRGQLTSFIQWNDNDAQAHIYLPNDIFEMLSKDEELNKSNGQRKSTHVAEAYSYLVLVTYLYRHCKYGWMDDTSMKALQQAIGFNYDYKKFNYVIKKNGVLDRLGLTKTISLKDAPVSYEITDGGYVDFAQEQQIMTGELEAYRKSVKNSKVKEPLFALYGKEGEYGHGTFFGFIDSDNIANTHKIDMKVFIECMTNDDLGCSAFYLYSFLSWKCKTSQGIPDSIEIGLDTISNKTGILRGARDKALHGLKAHNLINCIPAPWYVNGKGGEGSNIYSICGMRGFTHEPQKYQVRTLIPVKEVEVETISKKKEVK